MVRNIGKGDAINFHISSGQPTIVDNDKGLVITFKLIATSVGDTNINGLTPSLNLDFGKISAGKTAVAQFLMISSLQGTFTNYTAKFEYISPLGDNRLCQVEELKIHELEHVVYVDNGDHTPDFLVNDNPDLDKWPGMYLYIDR